MSVRKFTTHMCSAPRAESAEVSVRVDDTTGEFSATYAHAEYKSYDLRQLRLALDEAHVRHLGAVWSLGITFGPGRIYEPEGPLGLVYRCEDGSATRTLWRRTEQDEDGRVVAKGDVYVCAAGPLWFTSLCEGVTDTSAPCTPSGPLWDLYCVYTTAVSAEAQRLVAGNARSKRWEAGLKAPPPDYVTPGWEEERIRERINEYLRGGMDREPADRLARILRRFGAQPTGSVNSDLEAVEELLTDLAGGP